MPFTIDGTSGVPAGSIVQADLAANVAGNGPAFSSYMNATQALANAAFVKLVMNVEDFDFGSCYDTVAGRFQPTVAGYYQLNASVRLSATGLNDVLLAFYKNGAMFKRGSGLTAAVSSQHCAASALVFLNGSTDYIELYVYTGATSGNAAGAGTAPEYSHFSAFLARSA